MLIYILSYIYTFRYGNVERLKEEPQNIDLRNILLKASNIAGLAFSSTKTAAAHSISYPLTVHFDIPYGITSSMTLIPLISINKKEISGELNLILRKLKLDKLSDLKKRIKDISSNTIKYTLQNWGIKRNQIYWIAEQSFTKGRMDNNGCFGKRTSGRLGEDLLGTNSHNHPFSTKYFS